jgi:transposase
MSVQHVRKWCREFKDGHTDVHDEQRSGRPSVSDETIAKVEETMLKDQRVMVRELCEMIPDVRRGFKLPSRRGRRVLRFRHWKV